MGGAMDLVTGARGSLWPWNMSTETDRPKFSGPQTAPYRKGRVGLIVTNLAVIEVSKKAAAWFGRVGTRSIGRGGH